MDKVRKSANGKCQVSGRRQSVEKFDLEVHHIYDRKTYPQVAAEKDNMIAIASDIHTEFHKWVSAEMLNVHLKIDTRILSEAKTRFF